MSTGWTSEKERFVGVASNGYCYIVSANTHLVPCPPTAQFCSRLSNPKSYSMNTLSKGQSTSPFRFFCLSPGTDRLHPRVLSACKDGLFKKGGLCSVDVAVIIFSGHPIHPRQSDSIFYQYEECPDHHVIVKLYQYCSVDMNDIVHAFHNGHIDSTRSTARLCTRVQLLPLHQSEI